MVQIVWSLIDDTLRGTYGDFKYTNKLACFDLDGTLIKTKSGKKFSINERDQQRYSINIDNKISELNKNGFCIIIITNQAGLSNDDKMDLWKKKINIVCDAYFRNIPIKIFASIHHDIYRKPLPSFMLHIYDELKKQNMIPGKESFYCGDACGREGDHSDCDLKFALNSNLKFITPNEFFDNETIEIPPIEYKAFNELKGIKKESFKKNDKEMILMVGPPGSGKSYYVINVLEPLGYTRINRDTLGTSAKCIRETTKILEKGDNVVIDNLNNDKKTRGEYIKLALSYGYTIRCIIMDVSEELAMHQSMFRAYKGDSKVIPEIVYKTYKKKYIEPSTNEGIKAIIRVKPHIKLNEVDNDYKNLYMY